MKFVINGRLPGLNEIIAATNANRYGGAALKKRETVRCAWATIGKVKKIQNPISLDINWIEPNAKRDIDNISAGVKFVLDGLVEAGKLPNDGRKWVKSIRHHFPDPDAKNPRVEVEITDFKTN